MTPNGQETETIRDMIRDEVRELATWPYDDSGRNVELPLRPDVQDYTLELLDAAGPEPFALALALPIVMLNDNGTLRLAWTVDDNYLALEVRSKGILCTEHHNATRGAAVAQTHRDITPERLRAALNYLFNWLHNTEDS